MSNRDRNQKAARRLSREFPEESYSNLLRALRGWATEETLRASLKQKRADADAEPERLRP